MRKSIEFYREAYEKYKQIEHGKTARSLGKILGVDPTTVAAWRRGRTPESKYGPIDSSSLEQARHMLESGYSYRSVGQVICADPHTLHKHFPNRGWKSGPIMKLDHDVDDFIE